ncbi:hypothetical protein Poli38472_008882 [Pythium oligandrum]|uniref:Tectonic-1-3 N-terminal domain-containing protein n=1 Tax=Pythium oligandrum TaxID=41045 RepID=A0A8K1FCV4_PYTOL|nr:hypothetical protein Poli38472_008882 [Pythium oligandrum]|eukprot:TMW56234.1 hypothetical protein Poli38472_008882 [Pythium oligandrum]
MSAAYSGRLSVVRHLVEIGADKVAKCKNGWTVLMVAAQNGRADVVRYLVECGVDIESKLGYAPVNWSLVSRDAIVDAQKALTAPIGCSCVANSGASSCSFFECACTCDLTAGACDPFCCCDAECTSEHVETVKRLGLCVDTDPIAPSVEYCSADLTLSALSKSVDPLVAGSVLCVAVDNNEVVGDYITPAEEADMTVTNAFLKNPKPYSFLMTSEPSVSVVTMAKTAYLGSSLPVLFGGDMQVTCTLSLTASDFRSLCERNAPLLDVLRVNFTHAASFGKWLEIEYDMPTKRSSSFVDATDAGTVAC